MKQYNQLTELEKNEIIEAYFKNISYKDISNSLLISQRAVPRVLKENGINTKRKNRYVLNENYFEVVDSEPKAYILGLLFADGFVGTEKFNNIVISIQDQDKYILDKIIHEFQYTGKIRETSGSYESSGKQWTLNFSSEVMADHLRNYGIVSNRIYNAKIPNIEKRLIRHFIRGYFDGNGSISINNRLYETKDGICSCISAEWNIIASEPFLKEIESHLDCSCKYKSSNNPKLKYLRCLNKQGINYLYHYLYKDASIYLKRKFDKFQIITCPADK